MDRRVINLAHESDFALGDLRVHPSTREVSQSGTRSVVEPRVMQVLVALTQADGAVVSKDDLLARCWEGRIVGEDAINRVMSRLRKLSEETGAFRVETVTRIGYRLINAEIETRRAADGPPATVANDEGSPSSTRLPRRTIIAGGVALTAATAAGVWTVFRPTPVQAAKSVAVIPFRSLNGASQQYFSEGLSQEISVELASMPGMKVMAPTSTSFAVGQGGGLADVARRLNVDMLLSGSVQREDDTLRITCQLIDARSAFTVWADTFDQKAQDIFDIQQRIGQQVAGIISVQAGPQSLADRSGPAKSVGGTKNAQAYDAYLKGVNLLEKGLGEPSDRAAIKQFEFALSLDPSFARAKANLAMGYAAIGMYASPTPSSVAANLSKAVQIAEEAVALAPTLPIANTILGYILVVARYDFISAAKYYERGRQLGPGIAFIQSSFAAFAATTGRVAAARQAIAQALEIDPVNPARRRIATQIALLTHDFGQAVSRGTEALALNPRISLVQSYLGDALVMLRRFNEARDAYVAEPNSLSSWTGLAITEFHVGNRSQAQRWQERIDSQAGATAFYEQAKIWSQWGEFDKAMGALEQAWRIRDTGLTLLMRDPLLEPLHSNLAFGAMVRRMRFV